MQSRFLYLSCWKSKWPYFFILVVCLISYWPLTCGVFSVKNDALHYFLPYRYNISCAIQDGEWPLWSPYIYLGYPLHGDMQSGSWNPFVWIISLFGRYDLTVFHLEYLLYIFLSGAGMFKLSSLVSDKTLTRLFAATAYMLTGYMFGSGQFINWIASAAFVPFVCYYFSRFLQSGGLTEAILTGIFYWLLLVCGYPADVIYVFYILLVILVTSLWHKRKELNNYSLFKKFWWKFFLMIAIFLGLSAPAIISYTELLPYYSRGGGTSFEQSLQNSYEVKNLVSILNPWPTWSANFYSATDPTGRNLFAGISVLLLFFIALFRRWTRLTILLTLLLLFSFLFSLGDGFLIRKVAYNLLPGMDSFRHPSHFRLYVLLPMILLACIGFDIIATGKQPKKIFYLSGLALITTCLATVVLSYSAGATHFLNSFPGFTPSQLKQWIYSFDKGALLITGLLLQSFFLAVFIFIAGREIFPAKAFLSLHIANLIVYQVLLPVNFVSTTKPSLINKIIHNANSTYDPRSSHLSLLENSRDAFKYFDHTGLYYFYTRKPGISKITNSPSFLSDLYEFINNDSLYERIAVKPVAYLSDNTAISPGTLNNIHIGWNHIEMDAGINAPSELHLTQNFHHNWEAQVDGKNVPVQKSNIAFMSLSLEPGHHHIRWTYKPYYVYAGMIVFCVTVIGLLAVLIVRTFIKRSS